MAGIATGAGAAHSASVSCSGGKASLGGSCSLKFTDSLFRKSGPKQVLQVCFSTPGPNTVKAKGKGAKGACAPTSKGGVAHGVFGRHAKGDATVTATETLGGNTIATVTTVIH